LWVYLNDNNDAGNECTAGQPQQFLPPQILASQKISFKNRKFGAEDPLFFGGIKGQRSDSKHP